jgi:polyhydroxyalkanoate synthesis regulator protein
MPTIVIKRYPNRKLYNTLDKQYITLEGVGELIQKGNDVHVVDNATGEG